MPGQSRHFFELSAASSLSRALRRRESAVRPLALQPVETAPAEPAVSTLPPFVAPAVRYTEELWQALLVWLREGLGAMGTFAMDERGFPIARAGEPGTVPSEVLLAAFTSISQLLETYLGPKRPVRRVVVMAEGEPEVALMTFEWANEEILIGSIGGRVPSIEEVRVVAETVQEQLRQITGAGAGES